VLVERLADRVEDHRVEGHADVARGDLDRVGRGVEAGPPVDDAVASRVDRGEADLRVERPLRLLEAGACAGPRHAVLAHQAAEAGPGQAREHLGVPGEHAVHRTGGEDRAAHRHDPVHQVGSARGQPAGEHAAEAVAHDADLAAPPDRDRLQSSLEAVGRLAGAADVDVDLRAVGPVAGTAQHGAHALQSGVAGHEPRHEKHGLETCGPPGIDVRRSAARPAVQARALHVADGLEGGAALAGEGPQTAGADEAVRAQEVAHR